MTKIQNDDDPVGRMIVDHFFHGTDLPADRIGGWHVRGHDATGRYVEFVVRGNAPKIMEMEITPRIDGWIDFLRMPIEIGSPLLDDAG